MWLLGFALLWSGAVVGVQASRPKAETKRVQAELRREAGWDWSDVFGKVKIVKADLGTRAPWECPTMVCR